MMEVETLAKEVKDVLQSHTNPLLVKKYSYYFVEGYDAYGVDLKEIAGERNAWLKKYREEFGLEGFLRLGDLLVQSGKYEEGFIAIEFITHFEKEFTPATLEHLGRWLDHGLCNWAHTDTISSTVLPVFLVNKIVPLDAFSVWRSTSSKWKRRAVPVTLIKVLKTDFPHATLLEFIDPMMMDKEKVVHQGLGWFLRETWKKSPELVEGFLLKWKDQCARLIIQYATEKMTKEEKIRFKRTPKK
jgi:3-methyladenine DNA glycosylase AlkD